MLENYAMKIHQKKNEKFQVEKYNPDQELKSKDKQLLDKLNQIKYY